MLRLPFALALLVPLLMGGAARAQAPTPFVIGWGYSPDVPQIAVAYDKDLWKDQNLAPNLVAFPSGRESFEALIGGQLDLAIMSEFPPVSGALRHLKFSIAARLSRFDTMRVIARSATPITSLRQLEGKRIGTTIGTNVHFAISEALAHAGVKAELVNIGPSDIIPALQRGDVDAASMFPSAYATAKRVLGAQYQEVMLPEIEQDFILVASEKAAANPDLVKRVLAVLLKGEAVVDSDPKAAQEATFRYGHRAIPLEQLQAVWGDYKFHIDLTDALPQLMAREGSWVKSQGYVKEGTPTPEFYRTYLMPGPLQSLSPDRVSLK